MSKIETIALDELALSPVNARTQRKAEDVESMAASLREHGQLQNLVGHKEKGKILIAAGGTRLEGFRLLAERNQIKPSHGVAVKVTTKAKAAEASLAENIKRKDMHPADQLNAFEALQSTKSAEEIATSFGFPIAQVRRILALTGVSTALRERFARDELSMDTMQALSLFESHETQESVVAQCGNTAYAIKRLWRARGVAGNETKAEFVGAEDYLAAGGTLETDIFTNEVVFKDPELLETLYEQKLTATGETLRAEGWSWVEYETNPYPYYASREEAEYVWDSEESEAASAELMAQLETAEAATEGDDPEDSALEHVAELEDAIEQQQAAHKVETYTNEQKQRSGATYRMTYSGLRIERGIIKSKPRREGGQEDGEANSQPETKTMPGTVKETLTELHTLALQERIAQDAKAALALFICQNFDALPVADNGDATMAYRYVAAAAPCKVRVDVFTGEDRAHLPESGVYDRLAARGSALVEDAPLLESGDDILPWLLSLDVDHLLTMFSFVMARSVCAWAGNSDTSPLADMQRVLGYQAGDAIELTYDNFYSRLKGPQLMKLLEDNGVTEGINPKWKVKELARFATDSLTQAGFQHPYFA